MAYQRKFTFDDPEDSYWNENGSGSSSLFDDLPNKQLAARVALDDLFESEERRVQHPPAPANKHPQAAAPSTSIASQFATPAGRVVNEAGDGFLAVRARKVLDEPATSLLPQPVVKIAVDLPINSSASVVSETCSVSSLPSDAARLDLDYSRLRAEHKKLQRHLETVRHEKYRAPCVRETCGRLLKGDAVALDLYRSRAEKNALLDAAIEFVDSNVILTVVLFLRRTLSPALFRECLLTKREAAEEYIDWLKQSHDVDELATTLFALGRNADAAMVEYTGALRQKTTAQKVTGMKKCLLSAFSDPQLEWERDSLLEHIALLERQIPIQEADASTVGQHERTPLVGQPAIHTLYYSCLHHYDLPQNSLACPSSIRQLCRIGEKEYSWTAISALCRASRWPDVERVLQPRGLLAAPKSLLSNTARFVALMSWDSLFFILQTNGTPPPKDLLCRLLRAVPDQEERLRLAEKCDASEVIVECLVGSRDRTRLAAYAARLTPHTPDAYKAQAALSGNTKWKN